jgi:hypothetical protein
VGGQPPLARRSLDSRRWGQRERTATTSIIDWAAGGHLQQQHGQIAPFDAGLREGEGAQARARTLAGSTFIRANA